MSQIEFSSWLAPHLSQHLALKRACGYTYAGQARLLGGFDRFLVAHGSTPPLTTELLREFLITKSRLSPRSRDNYASLVWQALAYAKRHGAPIEALPDRPRSAPTGHRVREPFVLSHDQIERLLAAALELTPKFPFLRATNACCLGLLYTTGLRIDEALARDVGDLDHREQTLFVRGGKFKKDRLLPLSESTAAALLHYIENPLRPIGRDSGTPLFVSSRRRRLRAPSVRVALCKAARLAGLEDGSGRLPRPHDLRHTFAVHRIVTWYREGRDVNVLLPVLSTYMGHLSPASTYTYLRSAELLFGEAAQRFELSASRALDGRSA